MFNLLFPTFLHIKYPTEHFIIDPTKLFFLVVVNIINTEISICRIEEFKENYPKYKMVGFKSFNYELYFRLFKHDIEDCR